jgi:PadR family transcriptional regulator, regulatory protein PadR
MKPPSPLGEFEHIVLLAILRLDDRAYGVTIRGELAERAGREVAPGALYTTLDRLEDKGLVESRLGDPTAERGGRARRYYTVTTSGHRAIAAAQRALRSLMEGLNILGDSIA